jgi:putative transposase
LPVDRRRGLIERNHPQLSVARQCHLVGLSRSSLYYQPVGVSDADMMLMRLLDDRYTRAPFYGSRRMAAWLRSVGYAVGRRHVASLMRRMGLAAIYPKPRLSVPRAEAVRYPYLLRGVVVDRVNQVWSCDITYIRLARGFVYLMAIVDWYSRFVLGWQMSIALDGGFCLEALDRALATYGSPEIFNSDQGCQFTSDAFTNRLLAAGCRISRDGRGRALDNVFVERLWRSVKYEEVYLSDYESVAEARSRLSAYLRFYNEERLHQALAYQTPSAVYRSCC